MTRRRRVSILTASGGSLLLALFYIFGLNQSLLAANQAELSLTYSSPRGGAEYVSAHQSLAIRVGDVISDTDLSVEHITLVGSVSGPIAGELQVAEDNLTLIFDPVAPFMPGESIEAEINGSLIDSETSAEPLILTFTVSPKALDAYQPVVFFPPPASPPPSVDFDALSYKSLPAPLPLITATRHSTSTSTSEGFLFLSNIRWGAFDQTFPYLLVLNESGEPVYTHSGTYGYPFLDFKQQVDESWTFFDTATDRYQRLDPLTGKIEPIHTGNGYFADVHELLILPNGNAVIMIYDEQPFDMSPVVEGGDPEATVTGLVLQEIEPSGNVIFQWRSWDYFEITDAQDYDLTTNDVDYAHGNSIEVDQDGHWIISSRTMDEVTKISRESGELIWRLGGKNNDFTLIGDDRFFFRQHDARRLPNGRLSVFDNGPTDGRFDSRVVHYELDEEEMIATLVWSYTNVDEQGAFARAMGNAQYLPNGNRLIGWGSGQPAVSEVSPEGELLYTLDMEAPYVSYRAFRFAWEGAPQPPNVAADLTLDGFDLYVSSNGVVDEGGDRYRYEVVGVDAAGERSVVATANRTGYEDRIPVVSGTAYARFEVTLFEGDSKASWMSPFDNRYFEGISQSIFLPLIGIESRE